MSSLQPGQMHLPARQQLALRGTYQTDHNPAIEGWCISFSTINLVISITPGLGGHFDTIVESVKVSVDI